VKLEKNMEKFLLKVIKMFFLDFENIFSLNFFGWDVPKFIVKGKYDDSKIKVKNFQKNEE
jgi:hypothetical protein